jgi:copper homeostasis protein
MAGKELLKQLVEKADDRIIVTLGGGVRSNHIAELKEYTKATEFHSAAITKNNYLLDINEVKQLVAILKES